MALTKVTSSQINSISASQIQASGATAGQVLTFNGSTSTWVASAAPNPTAITGGVVAWVNFNGKQTSTGNIPASAINASYNISSVTRNGIGDYTINFSTWMVDKYYAAFGMIAPANSRWLSLYGIGGATNTDDATTACTVSSCRVTINTPGTYDSNPVMIAFLR